MVERKGKEMSVVVKVAAAGTIGTTLAGVALAGWAIYSMRRPDRFREDFEKRQEEKRYGFPLEPVSFSEIAVGTTVAAAMVGFDEASELVKRLDLGNKAYYALDTVLSGWDFLKGSLKGRKRVLRGAEPVKGNLIYLHSSIFESNQ